jgi:glycosyltransferase 2 family protein
VTRAAASAAAVGRGVGAATLAPVLGLRFFAAPAGQARARRGTDVVLFVVALAGLAVAVAAYPPSALERSLETFLGTLPGWLDPVWRFLADLLWLWAVALVVIALVRRRLVIVAQALGAAVLAVLLGLLAARIAVGAWPDFLDSLQRTSSDVRFPAARVAEATAAIVTVAPHLAHRPRRFGRWVLALGLVGAAIAGSPLGTLAGATIAIAAAAAVRLASGTSLGRPSLEDVRAGLAQLGIRPRSLEEAERQVAGVFDVRGVDDHGATLLIKVYGRDAYDTQLVARVWQRVWYRGGGQPIRLGRLEAVQHEAFVTLLARNGGVATLDVVTAAATIDDDALLVLRGSATPLALLEIDQIDRRLLRRTWSALARLDDLKIAHQDLDPDTVALVADDVGFLDFGSGTVAPTAAQLATDRAQLLVSTAAVAGEGAALGAAIEALAPDEVADLLPYLQSAALSPSLRRAAERGALDIDQLRADAAAAIGVEPPELAKLRRVSVRALVQIGLFGFAVYTILDAAAGIAWSDVWSSIRTASWSWLVAGFLVAQLPRLTQSLTTLGSVPTPLPFGPVYAMQLATGYMNVALPSGLARMAVNIRFFQRQGLSPATAVASGAIDSLAGTFVQAVLLGVLLLFTESSLDLDFNLPSGDIRILLWVLVAALVLCVLAAFVARRLRGAISARVAKWWPDVRASLVALRASHKLVLLLVGSLATEVLFATALGLFARGFGGSVGLTQLLVVNIGVSLLASIIPVPGGIGVAEFGLALGLTSAGLAAEAAVAAVLLYRISTYYLPPAWGFPALLWLQRRRYL